MSKQQPKHGPMGGGPPMMRGGEKAKDFKGTMLSLAKYLKPYTVSIIVVFIFAIASTVFLITGPKILGRATDKIVEGFVQKTAYNEFIKHLPEGAEIPSGTKGEVILSKMPKEMLEKLPSHTIDTIKEMDLSVKPKIDTNAISEILIFLIVLYLISAAFAYSQSFIMSGISQKVTYNLRRDISFKINKLPLKYFDSRTHGDVLSRVTNDVDTVSHTLGQSLTQMVTAITTIIGVLIMMFSISWVMTLIALLILPISFMLIGVVVKTSQKHFKNQQEYLGSVNGHIEEMYSGHNVIKAFNREDIAINEFTTINKKLYSSAWKSQFLSGMMMPIMGFVGNVGYVAICVIGGFLAVKDMVTIGGIQSFIQYLRQFNQPIAQVASIANVLQSTAAAAERVFEFLNEPEQVKDTDQPQTLSNVEGAVEFHNVSFGYNPEKIIIKDFSSKIDPGKKIAIVGPTGAGKTTIVKLLMRFYDVNSGTITVDGVNIMDVTRDNLRDLFGMVLQDTWLFNGTIRENIRYGRLDATDEEVYAAAKAAHVDHFVRTLPNGYDMVINEEASNISQGQKQLLTIARAIISNPKILILDEATSSVDTRTEVLIQKAMKNLMKGRTSFIIAHRLSTIRDADLILVMNQGDIVEQGNHEELMAKNGFYANLYNSQFESKAN